MTDHGLGLFLIDLGVLIVLGRVLGVALERVGQPAVLGEILAGIALGPSLLGAIAPSALSTLFPAEAMTLLGGIGNAGLVLFVFMVGLEIDHSTVRRQVGQVTKIAAGSFLLPFAVGVLVAGSLQVAAPSEGDPVSSLAFALFLGTAFAVTAFPVLARILTAEGLERSVLGTMSLAVAAILDLCGWLLLAVALTIAGGGGAGGILGTALGFAAFAVALVALIAPAISLGLRRLESSSSLARLSLLAAAIFACAGTTQLIGLHSVIGALLLGIALRREDVDVRLGTAGEELKAVTGAVLLPVYFAIAGMGVDVSAFGAGDVVELLLLVSVASAAKATGTVLGARWGGLSWRDSLPFGVLMNTRGLMEVVVLNIGLAAGILDVTLYTELMLVALIATLMTGPLIRRLRANSNGRLWHEIGRRRTQAVPRGEPDPLPQHSF